MYSKLYHGVLHALLLGSSHLQHSPGQPCVEGLPSLLQERGEALVDRVENIAPQYRTRPSLLAPAVRATAFGLGAVSSYLPNPLRASIAGIQYLQMPPSQVYLAAFVGPADMPQSACINSSSRLHALQSTG